MTTQAWTRPYTSEGEVKLESWKSGLSFSRDDKIADHLYRLSPENPQIDKYREKFRFGDWTVEVITPSAKNVEKGRQFLRIVYVHEGQDEVPKGVIETLQEQGFQKYEPGAGLTGHTAN